MAEARRSVRMTEDEAWQLLEESVNGILTTLRRDGRPVSLPIWYAVLDRRIYINTRGKKVDRAIAVSTRRMVIACFPQRLALAGSEAAMSVAVTQRRISPYSWITASCFDRSSVRKTPIPPRGARG